MRARRRSSASSSASDGLARTRQRVAGRARRQYAYQSCRAQLRPRRGGGHSARCYRISIRAVRSGVTGSPFPNDQPGLGVDIDERVAARFVPTVPGGDRGTRCNDGSPSTQPLKSMRFVAIRGNGRDGLAVLSGVADLRGLWADEAGYPGDLLTLLKGGRSMLSMASRQPSAGTLRRARRSDRVRALCDDLGRTRRSVDSTAGVRGT